MFKHRIVRGVLFYTAVFLLLALLPGLAAAEQDEFWTAKYWNNTGLGGSPVLVRQEDEINHNWGNGSPAGQVNRDYFSAQWKRKINLPCRNLSVHSDHGRWHASLGCRTKDH